MNSKSVLKSTSQREIISKPKAQNQITNEIKLEPKNKTIIHFPHSLTTSQMINDMKDKDI